MNATRTSVRLAVIALAGLGGLAAPACSHPDPGGPHRPPTTPTVGTSSTTRPGPSIPGLVSARDFVAYENHQGPDRPKLIVTGTVVVSSGNWVARLVPANPQGINPRILLVHLEVTDTGGPGGAARTERQVRLEAAAGYERVTILELGLDLPVTQAH